MGFAQGVVGGADPDGAVFAHLSPVMLAAVGAYQFACEGVNGIAAVAVIFVCPVLDFLLDSKKGVQDDDGRVGIGGMVLGQLTVVDEGTLGQVVFTVDLLEQKISGVGVIPQQLTDARPAPLVAQFCSRTAFLQVTDDGRDPQAGKVQMENGADDLRFFRNDSIFAIVVAVAQHDPLPGHTLLKILSDAPFLIFAGG